MKRVVLSLVIVFCSFSLFAQTVEISGIVFDENGEPMRVGCYVYTSKSNSTITDSLGRYSLSVPSNKETTLYFSLIVYKVTMFVIQMKNALRGLSAPAAWQTPEKFFI